MKTHKVIINGSGGCGKDTFTGLCGGGPHSVINLSMIDRVKEAAKVLGWDHNSKTDKDRRFLSSLRSLSEEYNNFSFDDMISRVGRIDRCHELNGVDGWPVIIFIHCREPKNIAALKNHFRDNCTTLLIERDGHEAPNCDSDLIVRNYNYDEIIYNAGTLRDLRMAANAFIANIIKEKFRD